MRMLFLAFLASTCFACAPQPVQPLLGQTSSNAQIRSASVPAVRDTLSLAKHVVRVVCKATGNLGTGFVHTSGKVITAAHVVDGCNASQVEINVKNQVIKVGKIASDAFLDVAMLSPSETVGAGLKVGTGQGVSIGDTVVTWGFPAGYFGLDAMVSVGYLAAIGPVPTSTKPVLRAFVNGAFNAGNSGGPVIDVQSQTVVGVVHAKLAPMPVDVQAALGALQNQSSGFVYTATTPDGRQIQFSEAQVVSRVLQHLQSQTQLVIGLSVLLGDLRAFLEAQGVTP